MENRSQVAPPTNIEVDKDRAVTLTWSDGSVDVFGIEDLRAHCPCAECRGLREQGRTVWPPDLPGRPLEISSAELVGAWGVSFDWNDGHTTGIFSWELLHNWTTPENGASE